MKKLFFKLFLLCCPVILYFFIFLLFDPNDYFEVRKRLLHQDVGETVIYYDGRTAPDNIYAVMKNIRNSDSHDAYTLVIGDSKCDRLSPVRMYNLSGEHYLKVSFGGASLQEGIEQFWYAADHMTVKKVLFEVDYYSLNSSRRLNRIRRVIDIIEKPFPVQYILDYNNNHDMLVHMYYVIKQELEKRKNQEQAAKGSGKVTPEKEEMTAWMEGLTLDKEINAVQKVMQAPGKESNGAEEERFRDFSEVIDGVCSAYQLDEDTLDDLVKIAEYCDENGIELIFFAPPLHRSIWDAVISKHELYDEIEDFKARLSCHAPVYDMLFYPSDLSDRDADWLDGHHFTGSVMEQMEKNLAGTGQQYMKIWEKGKAYVVY